MKIKRKTFACYEFLDYRTPSICAKLVLCVVWVEFVFWVFVRAFPLKQSLTKNLFRTQQKSYELHIVARIILCTFQRYRTIRCRQRTTKLDDIQTLHSDIEYRQNGMMQLCNTQRGFRAFTARGMSTKYIRLDRIWKFFLFVH